MCLNLLFWVIWILLMCCGVTKVFWSRPFWSRALKVLVTYIYRVNYSDIVNPSWLAFYGTVWCLGMWSRSLGFRGVCSFLVFLHPRLLGCGVISFFRLEGLGEKKHRDQMLASSTGHAVNAVHPTLGRLGLQVCDRNTQCMDWGWLGWSSHHWYFL